MRDPLLEKLRELIDHPHEVNSTLAELMHEFRARVESETLVVVHSAQHVVDIATLMFDRIMSIVLGYEPGSEVTRSLVAADKHPKARVVKAAVADIIEELTASELDQCLLEVEDSKVNQVTPVKGSLSDKASQEESRDTRQSSESNDNEDYGYIVCEVAREPGLEIQRDDEAGVFEDDDQARLQFVTDLERGSTYAKNMAKKLMGRPHWGYDIDNETMFYCSGVTTQLRSDLFAGDDREARRVAYVAAQLFEQIHADTDWSKEDYTETILNYTSQLSQMLSGLESSSIGDKDHLCQLLYGLPSLKERARDALLKLNAGGDLCDADDLLGQVCSILREVAEDG